jgi:hypothetical protein
MIRHSTHFVAHPQLTETHFAELVGSLEKPIVTPGLQTGRTAVKLVEWIEWPVEMLVGWTEMPVAMLAESPGTRSAQPVGSYPHSEARERHFEDAALEGW